MNEAEVKALRLDSGSQQGSRLWCQWMYSNGVRCDSWVHLGQGMRWRFKDTEMRVCRDHWNLLNTLEQIMKGNEGLTYEGNLVWERNYWMARGRAESEGDEEPGLGEGD